MTGGSWEAAGRGKLRFSWDKLNLDDPRVTLNETTCDQFESRLGNPVLTASLSLRAGSLYYKLEKQIGEHLEEMDLVREVEGTLPLDETSIEVRKNVTSSQFSDISSKLLQPQSTDDNHKSGMP